MQTGVSTFKWQGTRLRLGTWPLTVILLGLLIATPVLTIAVAFFTPTTQVWSHLVDTVLIDYIATSFGLMVGVAIGTSVLGVTTAWLVSAYDFSGRRFFQWALFLPMAMPAYILAYTYASLLDFSGPVQQGLRYLFGWSYGDYWFPDIFSLGGAVTVISFVLYPYVYLLSRAAFVSQSSRIIEASRVLGASPLRRFFHVIFPLARPGIIAGLALVLMEALADYGTVQYFGIQTFTTGIYRAWFGLGDSTAAAKLSAVLLCFVFTLLLLEQYFRGHRRFYEANVGASQRLQRTRLSGWRNGLVGLLCSLPIGFGFVFPVLQLLWQAVMIAEERFDLNYVQLVINSLSLALGAAFLTLVIALLLHYGRRLAPSPLMSSIVRVSTMGYAIPGIVVAVGVLVPLTWLDQQIDLMALSTWQMSTGLLLTGTVFALLFAYAVRFLSVSSQAVEAGLAQIKPSMDDSARSLGLRPLQVLVKVHTPLLKPSVLSAVLLVFVDVVKELPATLILRPFNFNTLAVQVYELASDERLADAAVGSLTILAIGLLPIILLSRAIDKRENE